jgi:hypothetical protein
MNADAEGMEPQVNAGERHREGDCFVGLATASAEPPRLYHCERSEAISTTARGKSVQSVDKNLEEE